MQLQSLPITRNIDLKICWLCKEEIDHFEQAHHQERFILGRERKDHYVNELYLYMKKVQTECI
jgi:hypothetical protein